MPSTSCATFVLGCILVAFAAGPTAAEEVKRVLMVHSFGSMAPPFTTHSTAFETTLTQEMGRRVDLDQVSLDMARYAQPDMEEAFVELLLKRLAKWQPDLVVPIGSPAGRFVNRNRERLFPGTPVIYTGMDRRTLPPGPLQNATFVGESFDLAGLVEDILQVTPDTTNIAVVIGASPLERYWAREFQRAFEPFRDRVHFTWFNDLSFDQMLERAANMPPKSFLLLALLIRDASGVTHNQEEALQRLRAVASAPINGLYQHELGLGIVGGRLYQAELQGAESARIAVRVLRGEPVSSFPPRIIPQQAPQYDWRELQRWNIAESRLPPGSAVKFRQPAAWQRYRWWIVGGLGVALLEAGLIVLLAVNLVKRRRVARALRQSEQRMDLAADSAGAGLWSVDLVTRQVWATSRLREMFQISPDEVLTYDRFLTVAEPQHREWVREFFEYAVEKRITLSVEFPIVLPDGSRRWIATRGQVEVDVPTRARRVSGASIDVTERKRAEERLRESESRFRTVADSAPALIWMSGVDKRCTFISKPWLEFTGRTAEQEMGDGWTESVHPDDRPDRLKGYVEAFEARQPFTLQYRLRRHDGEHRWFSDTGVPRFDSQGTFAGYIGSCLNITERLKAEAEAHELRQELAHIARVATMGELTAAIVHELAQPLAAILTTAQAGLRLIAAGKHDADQVREILRRIVADENRAHGVIEHLRSMFQKGEVERRPLMLNQVVNDVASVVQRDAERRQVALVFDLAPPMLWVSGDRIQLQQVLLNLIVNAFDALDEVSGRPRTVTLRTHRVDGQQAQVDVEDSGPGIGAERLGSIFNPFVTSKTGGMGMGLSVSRSIVIAHDGRLWVENGPSCGAIFHVVLPAIAAP